MINLCKLFESQINIFLPPNGYLQFIVLLLQVASMQPISSSSMNH